MIGAVEERSYGSTSQEAINTPAQCLYLADPHRLAVLEIKIIAQASIEAIQTGGSRSINQIQPNFTNESLPSSPNPLASTTGGKSSSSSSAAFTSNAPPSSYKSPNPTTASSTSSNTNGRNPRSRPRSVELGARAKEAFFDLGRGISYGFRNLSKSDLTDPSESSQQSSSRSQDDRPVRRGSRSSSSSSQAVTLPVLSDVRAEQQMSEKHARRIYSLRPQSLDLEEIQLSSTAVGVRISSRMEASLALPVFDSSKIRWERLGSTRTEFARDDEAQIGNSHNGAKRAGIFSAIQKDELGSEASDDDSESEQGSEAETGEVEGNVLSEALQLLLKVVPPFQYLRLQNSSGSNRESTNVILKARLRLGANSTPRNQQRVIPAGPRMLRSGSDENRTKMSSSIVFVSASSSRKLFEAVDASKLHRDGKKFNGPLSSADAARLEGIEWVPVDEGSVSSDVVHFEWKWKELGRGSAIQKDLLGEKNVKCACAFIELKEGMKNVRVLASFGFLVSIPSSNDKERLAIGSAAIEGPRESSTPSSNAFLEPKLKADNVTPSRPDFHQQKSLASSPTPTKAITGLGLGGMEQFSPEGVVKKQPLEGAEGVGMSDSKSASRRRQSNSEINKNAQSPILRSRRISIQSRDREQHLVTRIVEPAVEPTLMQVNHTEIQLVDVEEDGPILRAALQNLERRTASLKKAAKAILKASAEVRVNLSQLQSSEALLDQSMEHSALLAPSTWGFLSSEMLLQSRKEMHVFREKEKEMLEMHVEKPLRSVVEMCRAVQDQSKNFESESKIYYTATQKWLSSRSSMHSSSNNTSSTGRDVVDLYSPAAVGFDKASLKQERVDDKQKLRQARFHLARLEIFRALHGIHGGEAELQLATHVLTLCRWQCVGEAVEKKMKSFEAGMQKQLSQVREESEQVRIKCVEVEQQIAELQWMLNRNNPEGEGDIPALPSSESENAIGAATRQAGIKIKNILSSIGTNRQAPLVPQSVSIPPVSTWEADESPTKAAYKQRSKGNQRMSATPQIVSTSSSAGGGSNAFVKLHQRLRPLSFAAAQENQGNQIEESLHGHERSASDTFVAPPLPRLDSIGPVSPMELNLQLGNNSPTPRRSLSVSGSGAATKVSLVDFALRTPSSPTMNRHVNTGKSRASSDSQRPDLVSSVVETPNIVGSNQSHRVSLLQPRRAAQQSRKKEGILWAMSKPIVGAGGADAPKAVSRSQNWRECWVVLSGSGHLGEYADWKDVKIMEPSQPLIDLRFATVRESRGVERRFTFEVITRDCRRFFQASNELEMKEWTKAIGMAIESLLNGTSSIRQIDKVARVAGNLSPFISTGDEFGNTQNDDRLSQLGQHRAFSQSLTDLSSATSGGPARLFQRGGAKEESSKKRDSKGSVIPSGHLSTLSEGGQHNNSINVIDFPSTPQRSTALGSQHERGISNKTPVSGYVQAPRESLYESRPGANESTIELEEADYDRKIEEMIQSSYGGLHYRSTSHLSSTSPPSRQASQGGGGGGGGGAIAEDGLGGGSSMSTKYSRSREILRLAARPENSYCADCRATEPKWASWSVNGEPRCIFICITCSGIHRSLGVSVSRVKSVELDDWTEEQLDSARHWGNDLVNELYEARKPRNVTVATFGDSKNKLFWKEKYVKKAWYEESLKTTKHTRNNYTEELDAMESMEDDDEDYDDESDDDINNESDIDQTWDGTTSRKPKKEVESRRKKRVEEEEEEKDQSSKWTSSPPVVFVSMLEGEAARWTRTSIGSLEGHHPSVSGEGQSSTGRHSLEDSGPFTSSQSPPLKPSHFTRFPRRSLEKRPATTSNRFSPSLAAA